MKKSELSQILHEFEFNGFDESETEECHGIAISIDNFVKDVNSLVHQFIERNSNAVVELGPKYYGLNYEEASRNLRLYRFCNKFSIPSESDSIRAERSVNDMLDYDEKGLSDFNIADVPSVFHRYQLQNARFRLQKLLAKKFRLDISDFDMPSGETNVSNRGNVSIYTKLKDLKQWQCSPSNFDLFAQICYNSPGLKFAAKQHIKNLGFKHFQTGKSAFERFKFKLRKIVTFVDVSRVTTVPKNAEVDRVILCEPMCNMICQRCIAKSLVEFINKTYEIDLYDAQSVHGALLTLVESSTIDLKNASNSNWLAFIRWFLSGTKLLGLLEKSRIPTVQYKDNYHHLKMISPMGNGFTFEVMTLILLTITREFDSFAHVFGDDIIVDEHVAKDVTELLTSIGYNINTKKTFIGTSFKESCGSFVCDGKYITSFDIKYSTNVAEAISTVNKIFVLQRIDELYAPLYRSLVKITPVALLSGDCFYQTYCNDPRVHYLPKSYKPIDVDLNVNIPLADKVVIHPRQLRKARKRVQQEKKTPTQWELGNTDYEVKYESKTIVFSKRDTSWFPIDNVEGVLIYHFLYSGVGLPTLRKGITSIRRM